MHDAIILANTTGIATRIDGFTQLAFAVNFGLWFARRTTRYAISIGISGEMCSLREEQLHLYSSSKFAWA
jgi:hypothetical protein